VDVVFEQLTNMGASSRKGCGHDVSPVPLTSLYRSTSTIRHAAIGTQMLNNFLTETHLVNEAVQIRKMTVTFLFLKIFT
jgi:hypothetical protein